MVTLRAPPFGITDLATVTLVEPAVPLGPLTVKLSVAFSELETTSVTVLLVPMWKGLLPEPPLFGMLMLGNVMELGCASGFGAVRIGLMLTVPS